MIARRTLASSIAVAVAVLLAVAVAEEAPKDPEAEAAPAATSLNGTVRGADETPLRGATVRIVPAPDSKKTADSKKKERAEPLVVKTGEDGRFEVTGLSGEKFTVRVEAEGHAPLQESGIPAGASLTLHLEPGRTLTGRVVALDDGAPLPGVSVEACDHPSGRFGDDSCVSGTTDDEGRFSIPDLPDGKVRLTAVSPRHARAIRDIHTPSGDEPVEIALVPGGSCSGVVVGPDGEPVEGVSVGTDPIDKRKLHLDSAGAATQYGKTDDTGWFEIEGLPAPGRYRFRLRKDGYAITYSDSISLEPGDARSDLVFPLTKGAAFKVRLVDTDEQPVRGLDVRLLAAEKPDSTAPSKQQWVDTKQIRAEADGRFVVENLDPGTVTVRLWPEDGEEVVRESVRLREGATVDLGVIVVKPGLSIDGIITDADGEPIDGATINAVWLQGERRNRHARTESGADGRFRLSGLGESTVNLQIFSPGFVVVEERDVDPGTEGLEFVLERPGKVLGRVVLENGTGVTASVRGLPAGGGTPFRLGRSARGTKSQSDANGYFDFAVRDGKYVVEATAPGMKPSRVVDVEVVAGEETDLGTIVLSRGITLRGRVVRADDETPVVGAAVKVAQPGPLGAVAVATGAAVPETVVTLSDGSFRVQGLEPGPRAVQVEHPSFAPAESQVELVEGVAPPEVIVRLGVGGVLTGAVRGRGGVARPGAGVTVVVTSGFDPTRTLRATTDEEGQYVFERVRPGNYQVMLSEPRESGLAMKPAVITEGETTVVDFDDEAAITLEGRVLRGDEPLGGVGLFFLAGSAESITAGPLEIKTTQADDAGNYSIGLDHGGTYQVQVQTRDNPMMSGAATVELVVPDEPRVQRDIVLRTAGISGTVTTDDGEPVAGAFVTAQPDGVEITQDPKDVAVGRTDAEGAYKLGGLEDGVYRVTVTADGYAPAERKAIEISPATPDAVVDLVLRRGRLLRGKVIDPAGNVVQGAMVYVTPAGSTSMAMMPAISDVQGQFETQVPSDDPVDVLVLAGGWAPTVARGVNPDTEGLEVRVSRGGSVRVRVTREDGAPVSGVQVRCMPTDPTIAATAAFNFRLPRPTDANGVTVVDLLAPGQYEVTVPDRPRVRAVPVEVRAGTESSADLSLQRS